MSVRADLLDLIRRELDDLDNGLQSRQPTDAVAAGRAALLPDVETDHQQGVLTPRLLDSVVEQRTNS